MASAILSAPQQVPFIGRARDMNNVTEAFMDTILSIIQHGEKQVCSLTKLALICGGPLVGKTRCAVETAQELKRLSSLSDVQLNVHSVELQGLCNARQVEAKMASAMLPWQQRDTRMLRGFRDVLDDLEDWHLFILDGAECFGGNNLQNDFMVLCQEVIEGSSRVLIMITSQWKFNFIRIMKQVLPIHLNPFLPEESKQLLFSVATDLEESGNEEDIDEIIKLCGGIPFALELVGADLRDQKRQLADIIHDLNKGYREKRASCQTFSDSRDGDESSIVDGDGKRTEDDGEEDRRSKEEEHLSNRVWQTLEQLMESSVDKLSCPVKKRLTQLNFISASFTAEAAACITNINPTSCTKRDLLIPLHTRSLIAIDTLTNRFNILSFLRLYIEERYSLFLSPEETDLVRVRYCGFYARLLQRAAELLEQDNACKSIPIFTAELQNMQKLLQESIHCFEDSYDLFVEVAYQARHLILLFIPTKDAISFYQACLEAAERRKDKQRQARILISLGRLVRYVDGDMKYAEELYRQALGLLARDGDSLDHAAILSVLGFYFFDSARPKLAISYQEETLEMIERLERNLGDDDHDERDSGREVLSPRMQLWRLKEQTLVEMACTHARLAGNSIKGISCHEQSIEIQKRLWKDHLNIGENYYCMAMVYHNMGYKEHAVRYVLQALEIIERLCTQPSGTLLVCYIHVAAVLCGCEDDFAGAMRYIKKAHRVQSHLKTKNILVFCLHYIEAKIVARSGNLTRARQMFKEGFGLAMPILGEHLNTARTLQSEGWAALRLGDCDDALETLQHCLEMRQKALKNMKWNVETAETFETMGDACAAQYQQQRALDYYEHCYHALADPIRCYTKMRSPAAEKVKDLRSIISRKMGIVSRNQKEWDHEERALMTTTVIYDYNYWPMI
ncbi:uncharacterized protein LOC129259216 [Lytechinus pictus]|uniref:uncharacterized protein LOC129259216 n=1 Tax=Lytechinus pictus TaxID=7653 RepID=UPI0030B9D9AA